MVISICIINVIYMIINTTQCSYITFMLWYIYLHTQLSSGEKIIELNNKHQFKKNKQVKKGCAKVKEKVEILISFE